MKQTLGRSDRLKRRADFTRIFERGRAAGDRLVRLIALPNRLGRSRVGVAISKRHGSAVRRNGIKRLCREAFRTCRADLPAGYDYVMLPRAGAEMTVEALRRSLRALSVRVTQEAGRGH